MPFVSSFLSVHLSERTSLSRPLTCSSSPYHLKQHTRIHCTVAAYVVSVLPLPSLLPSPFHYPSLTPFSKERKGEREREKERRTEKRERERRRRKNEPRDTGEERGESRERPGNGNFTGSKRERRNRHVEMRKKGGKKNALSTYWDCFRPLSFLVLCKKEYLFDGI